jgi:hypothetical protein
MGSDVGSVTLVSRNLCLAGWSPLGESRARRSGTADGGLQFCDRTYRYLRITPLRTSARDAAGVGKRS